MVKKIIYILTIICSIIIGMESYDAIRHNDFGKIGAIPDYLVIQEKHPYKYIELKLNKNAKKYFHEILSFCNERNVDFIVGDAEYIDGEYHATNYIYSKKKNLFSKLKIVNYQDIDFSDIKSNQYYTTNINDKNSRGILRTIDEYFFDNSSQFTIKNMYETDKIIELLHSTYYGTYFYINDKDYQDLEKVFKENRIQYEDITKGYSPAQIQEVQDEEAEYLENILLSSVIIIGLLISVYLLKSHRKIMIMRLNGVSILKIIRIMIFPFFVMELLLFSLGLYLTTYFCAGYINQYNSDMYFSNIDIIVKFFGLLLILSILVYIFIHFTSHLKYLKKNRDIKHYMELSVLLKVVLIGIMLPQLITIVPKEISSLLDYIALNMNKDYMSSLAVIDGLESIDGNIEVFNKYIHTEGIYVDFDYYVYNQEDYLREFVEEENWHQIEDSILRYPMIYANANYLENKKLYDDSGRELNLKSYDEDVLLVPRRYAGENLSNAMYSKELKIIYIKDNGVFYNTKPDSQYYLINPVIHLVTKKSEEVNVDHLYLPITHKSIAEYQKEIKETIGEDSDIRDNKEFIQGTIATMKENLYKDSMVMFMYMSILLIIIYQSVYLYIHENSKKLALGYMFGYSKKERYFELLIYIPLTYVILTLVGVIILKLGIKDLMIFMIMSSFVEGFIYYVLINRFENRNISNILKGENEL